MVVLFVGLFKVLRVEPHKLLWENLLVEDEAAALMVGLGIVEAVVVRVEALQEGDTARQILSWMRLVTNQPSLPSCNTFAATPIAVSHLVVGADRRGCGTTKPMFIT